MTRLQELLHPGQQLVALRGVLVLLLHEQVLQLISVRAIQRASPVHVHEGGAVEPPPLGHRQLRVGFLYETFLVSRQVCKFLLLFREDNKEYSLLALR